MGVTERVRAEEAKERETEVDTTPRVKARGKYGASSNRVDSSPEWRGKGSTDVVAAA